MWLLHLLALRFSEFASRNLCQLLALRLLACALLAFAFTRFVFVAIFALWSVCTSSRLLLETFAFANAHPLAFAFLNMFGPQLCMIWLLHVLIVACRRFRRANLLPFFPLAFLDI